MNHEESGNDFQRQALDTWQILRNRLGLIITSTILIFAIAVLITYIMPRKYRGVVEMRIERFADKLPVFSDRDPGRSEVLSEQWMKTEVGTINKSETLYPVIDALGLTKAWKADTRQVALAMIKSNLETQNELRSDIVKIEFYDQDRNRAAEIANAVAESYMHRRVEVEKDQKTEALAKLDKQITEQESLARDARNRRLAAQKEAGILSERNPYGMRLPGMEVGTEEGAMVNARETEELRLRVKLQDIRANLEQLDKLSPDQIVANASGFQLNDTNIVALRTELNRLQIELEGLRNSGLGARHSKVKGVMAQVDTTRNMILQAAESHRSGLRAQMAATEESLKEMEAFNKDSKDEALDKQASHGDYLTISREVENIEETLYKLKQRASEARADIELVKSPATILAPAEPEMTPAKPNVPINLALGGILGLMLGVGLAFGLESLDTTVKSLDDVERSLGVPVLAVIPKDVGVLHRNSGFTPDAEAYRVLRTNIEFNRRNPNANCLTVVSGGAGEGKSTTLTNLAFVCAQGGYNVLLIDGDMRRPRLHTLFDVDNTTGLSSYLTTNMPLEEVVVQTPVENLYFLPSGLLPADSAGILNSQRMSELIEDVKARFDLVLIDSPPILGLSDASVLVNEADLTIIVVQHRKLPRHMLLRVKQSVENVGGKVLGVVLNNVDTRSDSQYQYYTSYYSYYSPTNAAAPAGKSRKKKSKSRKASAETASTPSVVQRVTQAKADSDVSDDLF